MAEALCSAIVRQLVTIGAQNAREEFRLVTGVEKEVQDLEITFKAIQCVVEDAERKQFVDKSVGHWLERLKQISYDMEDVLDEWKNALDKLEAQGFYVLNKKKVWPFVSCFQICLQFAWRHPIAVKIKEIKRALDKIALEKDRYQLARTSEMKQPRRLDRESTSFVDVSLLHGRDEVKSDIVSNLLDGSSKMGSIGIQTISIVGMGGIGKTALAQMIYNDARVKGYFRKVIWVCVSDSFDQNKIARAILGGLDQHSTVLQNPNVTLQIVLDKICEKIKGETFLLVLDDVWTDRDEDWQQLKAIFQQGVPGSRVLVTTRKESVATGLGSSPSQVVHLEQVSNDVCWKILSQMAFVGSDDNKMRESLEDVGREIAKKCKGSPLAAKTLGGLLREKRRSDEWQNILNSEMWKFNVAEEHIFTPFLLSYYDLPSEIRPCLLYCALFPKDFVFSPEELIKHWIAHGYLNSCKNSGVEEEEKGKEYFNYLASRCFFQEFQKAPDGDIWYCKMHDVVHDFVQHLTKDEIVSVAVDGSESLRLDPLSSSLKKAHHLRVMIDKEDQLLSLSRKGIEKLRSLITVGPTCDVSGETLQELFKGAKCLRLLGVCLSSGHHLDYLNVRKVPNEIGKLIHLRFLDLSGSLEYLPEEVCELKNLQYLNLLRCTDLKKLPDGIGKLINLRSLSCHALEYYPKGISTLTSLRELYPVIARVDGKVNTKEFSIGDLENLDLLRGEMWIKAKGDVVDKGEAKRAQLHKKIHLTYMFIERREANGFAKLDLIQALDPPPSFRID